MHIQIIIGSIREGRAAEPIAEWTARNASDRSDFSTELIDLKEWDLPMFALSKGPIMGDYEDELQKRWAAKIAEGDAFLFVTPEYNHGYSSVLKNALDYIYAEWVRKPAGFVSYGGVNGARSVEQLRQVVIELQMAPIREALHIASFWDKLDDNRFQAGDKDLQQLNKVLDELTWWGHALKNARESG